MFRCRRSSTYSHQTKNSRFCAARRKTLSTLLLFPLYPENKHCLFKDVSNPLHGSAACKGVPSVNRYPPVPPPAYLGKYIRFWTKIIATIVIVKLIQAQYLHSPKNLQDVHSKWSLKSTSLQLQHICPWPPPATNFLYTSPLGVHLKGSRQIGPRTIRPRTTGPWTVGPRAQLSGAQFATF